MYVFILMFCIFMPPNVKEKKIQLMYLGYSLWQTHMHTLSQIVESMRTSSPEIILQRVRTNRRPKIDIILHQRFFIHIYTYALHHLLSLYLHLYSIVCLYTICLFFSNQFLDSIFTRVSSVSYSNKFPDTFWRIYG